MAHLIVALMRQVDRLFQLPLAASTARNDARSYRYTGGWPQRDEDALDVNTLWVRNKTTRFSYRSTPQGRFATSDHQRDRRIHECQDPMGEIYGARLSEQAEFRARDLLPLWRPRPDPRIHSKEQNAFDGLYGSPDGRYPKPAGKAVTLRAPDPVFAI